MKYVLQEDVYKSQKINVSIANFDDVQVNESDQVFVATEEQMLSVQDFFKLLNLPFKYVLPPEGMYIYSALLSESDADKLIAYQDFLHIVELVPKDLSSLDVDDQEDL